MLLDIDLWGLDSAPVALARGGWKVVNCLDEHPYGVQVLEL